MQHTLTFHHQWFINPWDRLPRLRAGNVHNYNIYVDDTLALAARRLRDAREAAMSTTSSNTLNNTYNFKPFLNGSISTEGGAMLVEKSVYIDCLTPLRNNQTDPSDPTYTGKILALDTIYQMDSTIIRGDSTDPGNPLGPFQAPIIPFSWNLPGQSTAVFLLDGRPEPASSHRHRSQLRRRRRCAHLGEDQLAENRLLTGQIPGVLAHRVLGRLRPPPKKD